METQIEQANRMTAKEISETMIIFTDPVAAKIAVTKVYKAALELMMELNQLMTPQKHWYEFWK